MLEILEEVVNKYGELEAMQVPDIGGGKCEELKLMEEGNEEYLRNIERIQETVCEQQSLIKNKLRESKKNLDRIIREAKGGTDRELEEAVCSMENRNRTPREINCSRTPITGSGGISQTQSTARTVVPLGGRAELPGSNIMVSEYSNCHAREGDMSGGLEHGEWGGKENVSENQSYIYADNLKLLPTSEDMGMGYMDGTEKEQILAQQRLLKSSLGHSSNTVFSAFGEESSLKYSIESLRSKLLFSSTKLLRDSLANSHNFRDLKDLSALILHVGDQGEEGEGDQVTMLPDHSTNINLDQSSHSNVLATLR